MRTPVSIVTPGSEQVWWLRLSKKWPITGRLLDMRQYFQKMTPIGKALSASESKQAEANALEISKVDQEIAAALETRKKAGIPAEVVHKRGEKTAWERIDHLV